MIDSNKPCLICGEGHLHQTIEMNPVTYNGVTKELPLYGSTCDVCGSEQADAEDTRMNKRAMQEFKREVDGLLSGAEIAAIREQYDITQKQAAKIFGGGPVAFSKYESGDVIQSEPMNNLLLICRENVDAFISLASKAGELDIANSLSIKQAETLDALAYQTLVPNLLDMPFDMTMDTGSITSSGKVVLFINQEAA